MKISIDRDKLKSLIAAEVEAIMGGTWLESSTPIGEIEGVQIKLVVTSDEDEIDEISDSQICIEGGL